MAAQPGCDRISVFLDPVWKERSDRAGSYYAIFSIQLTLISAFLLLANIFQQVKTPLLPLSNTDSLLTPSDIRRMSDGVKMCRRRQAPGS